MEGSYVKANSIHRSFQRAVTTHDTDRWEVRDNVAFDVMGHAYFMEDGAERFNSITGNLGVLTKKSSALLEGDNNPACFWTATPMNFWSDNVAAHSQGRGFWFELAGSLDDAPFCPVHMQLGEFENNTFHTNRDIGLRIYPQWTPLEPSCGGQPVAQYLRNMVSFRNGGNGLFSKDHGDLHHVGAFLMENGGYDVSIVKLIAVNYDQNPHLLNCIFVGKLYPNPDVDPEWDLDQHAILSPQEEYWYGKNLTFVNYGRGGALSGCNDCLAGSKMKQGAHTIRYENLKWVNTELRILYANVKRELFWDLDGTLGGVPDSMIVRSNPHLLFPECTVLLPTTIYGHSVRCGGSGSDVRIRKLTMVSILKP